MRVWTDLGIAPPLFLSWDLRQRDLPQALRLHQKYNEARWRSNRRRVVLYMLWWPLAAILQLPVVGWDIALTPKGALLVEGNSSPCVIMVQKLSEKPLGSGRFGELLIRQLEGATRP
jgi:hypothetical protein